MQESDVYKKLQGWAAATDWVRAMILTSSRVDLNAHTDIFSDYDVELYVSDINKVMNDEWLGFFGDIMICWPLKPLSTFDSKWITRLVLFENGVRIDFQITSQKSIEASRYDSGYKVLSDKDHITSKIPAPTHREYLIKKPTEEEYETLIHEFFWDATYVPKHLWRDELFFAKYMLDNIIRFEYLERVLEWYIAMQHDWSINTNTHGRYFKRYLDAKTWKELEETYAGADIEENWKAFFKTVELFRGLARALGKNLGYKYPDPLDSKMTEYYRKMQSIKNSNK